MKYHKYTTSEYLNLKWFIKRIIKSNYLDQQILEHISKFLEEDSVSLNLGCGYWTPYDFVIRRKSRKVINLDTSYLVRLFHIYSGKRCVVNDDNIYELIMEYKIGAILSFHSISFIQIDLPKLINYCVEKKIVFLFDWSILSDEMHKENFSKYCYGEGVFEVFEIIERHNLFIMDTKSNKRIFNRNEINVGGRYLVSTQLISSN